MSTLAEKAPAERDSRRLTLALCVVYFAGYMARLDYATVIAEIVVSMGLAKSEAALATTACFITYGVGQLVSGWLGDHISPRWLIFGGLAATSVFNLLLPLAPGVGAMTAIWAANGLAQAMLWPPMMRMMTGYMSKRWVERCCVDTSVAANGATVMLYLVSPAIIAAASWRGVFYIASGFAAAVSCGWLAYTAAFEKRRGALAVKGAQPAGADTAGAAAAAGFSLRRLIWEGGLLFVMVGIVMQGTLRDGVTTWLPSYLVEVFRLETGASILSSVVIPLFSILSFWVCAALCRRVFGGSEIHCSVALFCVGATAAGVLAVTFGASAASSVFLASLLAACMHGVNLMLICNLPARFGHTGRVSMISGTLNACTYIGSALSTWGFALVAQSFGWRATVVCWAAICLVGAAACVAAARRTRALFAAHPAPPQ